MRVMEGMKDGIEVSADVAEVVAPILSAIPATAGIGAAMSLYAPIAEKFLVAGCNLFIKAKEMTPEEMRTALEASKSKNWPKMESLT